jgi:tRNA(adenine34) deaminase
MEAAHFTLADERHMRRALALAARAAERGEAPIGAVLAREEEEIAAAHNERELRPDPTAHAEILALRAGAERLGGWRLPATTLYVTLEPCAMCAMAIVHARVARLVFAAADPKTGACGSVFDLLADPRHNHCTAVESGLLAAEAGALLRDFFRRKRSRGGDPGRQAGVPQGSDSECVGR